MVMPREERPPYVSFEVRPVEDRARSLAAGHWVGRDVDYVLITPTGSKDRIERVATEWLKHLEDMVREQRFPAKWLRAYQEGYKAWKTDQDPPLEGTPIRNWPVVSPSQYKMLKELRVLTVEDLAQANEETLMRIGPGARGLKAKAETWLTQAREVGVPAEELERLREDNRVLNGVAAQQQLQLNELRGRLEATQANPRGVVIDGGTYSPAAADGGVTLDMEEVLGDGRT